MTGKVGALASKSLSSADPYRRKNGGGKKS